MLFPGLRKYLLNIVLIFDTCQMFILDCNLAVMTAVTYECDPWDFIDITAKTKISPPNVLLVTFPSP